MSSFEEIKDTYKKSFDKYGDSPKSILTPKGRNNLRYSVIEDYIDAKQGLNILDYGCGLGYLYEYLKHRYKDLNYHGYDFVNEFIEHCNEKHANRNIHFSIINPQDKLKEKFDVVFASGVFNLKTSKSDEESKNYALSKINELYNCSKNLLICDFPSEYVDFTQPGAQHFSLKEISDYCVNNLGRKFIIRHDKLPYEFTLVVWKNDNILKPSNIFEHGT